MTPAKIKLYRNLLIDLRERVGGEVNYVVESIHQDVDINANVSSAPVHLADVAAASVDADVQVLNMERGILDQINAALERVANGAFGRCMTCGTEISEQRLKALPYAAKCAHCARAEAEFNH